MFQFGVGGLFVNPIGGNLAVNPTPYELLTVQDVSVDISQELKELVGNNKFPDDIAPGQMKVSGKFTVGYINMPAFNQVFFAGTQAVGSKQIAKDEAATVATTTATVTNSTTFLTDLGVRYANGAGALVRKTTSPAIGQYSVAAGVYTFGTGDTNATGGGVLISYVWTSTTVGVTLPINNQLMGFGPVFEMWMSEPYQQVSGNSGGIHLYACRLAKFGQAFKNTDYDKPEMDFSSFANAAGQVGEMFSVVP